MEINRASKSYEFTWIWTGGGWGIPEFCPSFPLADWGVGGKWRKEMGRGISCLFLFTIFIDFLFSPPSKP